MALIQQDGSVMDNREQELNNPEIDLILQSDLFDKNIYETSVGKTFISDASAVEDYLGEAINFGAKVSVVFDSAFYLTKYQDIKEAGINPLLHYVRFGVAEGREPSAIFKPEYFLSQLMPEQQQVAASNPLKYFLNEPASARPHVLFDTGYYYSQLDVAVEHPFVHYLTEGYQQGLSTHPLFDVEFFKSCCDARTDISPLEQYCLFPADAPIRVHPLFDPGYYVARHPDALSSGMDALSHYILVGSNHNYWPMALFMSEYYVQTVSDDLAGFDSPLTHYVMTSGKTNPCPWFDKDFYLDSYKFVADDSRGALAHYYYDGWKHDFMPSESFAPKYMKSRFGYSNSENPLVTYVNTHPGAPTLPQKGWHDAIPEFKQLELVQEFFKNTSEVKPVVSVIIPVYNNFAYTLRCLYSIAIAKDKTPFEVIIADDQSSDETETKLNGIEGIKYVRNPSNLGFLRSCNNAAKSAEGDYIFLLNNDTAVLNGWLDSLVATFNEHSNLGLVGSKLLYPNGLLQEAGGILWSDGAANYGKFDDPDHPRYSYLRQADYISGAAIMVPTPLWNLLEGFDERFAPAYCEDSDLCLQIRNMGFKVMMQPQSKVVHFEGISSGTDLNTGVKKYQVINSEKLKSKWESLLSQNGLSGDFSSNVTDRAKGGRILIIDATIPTPDQDAGSLTVWYFLKILKQLGFKVTFVPENLNFMSPYTEMVQSLGVECLHKPYLNDIDGYIQQYGKDFDAVMLYRVGCGGRFYETVRRYAPQAKIIFDTVDLHFLREERQAKMEKDKQKSQEMLYQAMVTRERELFLIRHSDISIVLSEYEKDMLSRDWAIDNTFIIPIVLEVPGKQKTHSERKNIAFIGGYQHTPNVDAVMYFVENKWPKIKEKIQGIKFYVIGSKPPQEILELQEKDEDIIVTGFVESLDPYMEMIRLTVAPLRYGAGIKGKIGSSLSYGVPCIATKVAAEGMGLVNGENILMSDEESTFIENLVSTYNNAEQWNKLSDAGIKFVEEQYSIEATRNKLLYLFNSVAVSPFTALNPFTASNEVMRLTAEPSTDLLLCDSFKSTVSHRLLAQNVIDAAKELGIVTSRYSDIVEQLATKGIAITSSDTNLPTYLVQDCSCSENGYCLAEFDFADDWKLVEATINRWNESDSQKLFAVIKGESISAPLRAETLSKLYQLCNKHELEYHVYQQCADYPSQQHINFSITAKMVGG